MFKVRLAGGHLYGKQLFTWLSLVVSLMASFVLSFSPLDVLDEIWDLIESVSEGFLTYSCWSVFDFFSLSMTTYFLLSSPCWRVMSLANQFLRDFLPAHYLPKFSWGLVFAMIN